MRTGEILKTICFTNFLTSQSATSNNHPPLLASLDSSLLALWPTPVPSWTGALRVHCTQSSRGFFSSPYTLFLRSHGVSWKLSSTIFNISKYAYRTTLILWFQVLIYTVFWLQFNFKFSSSFNFFIGPWVLLYVCFVFVGETIFLELSYYRKLDLHVNSLAGESSVA